MVATATLLGLTLSMTYMCYRWRRKDKGISDHYKYHDFCTYLQMIIKLLCFCCDQSERRKLHQEQILLASIRRNLDGAGERGPSFTLFSFSRVADATENFSSANKIGEGGFGPVYKAIH